VRRRLFPRLIIFPRPDELHFDKILDTEEMKAKSLDEKREFMGEFAELIGKKFGLDISEYRSLANIGQAILEREGCFAGVVLLCGEPAEFIRLCQASPLVQARNDRPVKIEGNIQQIDRRGSYCAVYTEFQGIPKGVPKTMETFDPSAWDYFYVCVDVKSFAYKEEEDPFPLLRTLGRQYMDKVMFDAISKRYTWEFQWLSGYGFNEGFNWGIKEVAQTLWDLRMKLRGKGNPLQAVVKRMINSLFGKSIARERLTANTVMSKSMLLSILNRGAKSRIFWFKKVKDGENYAVKFVKSIVMNWIRPQFGVNVLNWSRVSMQTMIDRAEAACAPVYYVNTDCMVMREGLINHVNQQLMGGLLGEKLGQFDWELPVRARKFVCISRRSYMFALEDGTYKVRFGPKDEDPEAWFDAKFEQRTLG
jgi:hypothetical protein